MLAIYSFGFLGQSEGLLFSVVFENRPSPEGYEWLPAVAAKLISCSKTELAKAGARRAPRNPAPGFAGRFLWLLSEAESRQRRAALPAPAP